MERCGARILLNHKALVQFKMFKFEGCAAGPEGFWRAVSPPGSGHPPMNRWAILFRPPGWRYSTENSEEPLRFSAPLRGLCVESCEPMFVSLNPASVAVFRVVSSALNPSVSIFLPQIFLPSFNASEVLPLHPVFLTRGTVSIFLCLACRAVRRSGKVFSVQYSVFSCRTRHGWSLLNTEH